MEKYKKIVIIGISIVIFLSTFSLIVLYVLSQSLDNEREQIRNLENELGSVNAKLDFTNTKIITTNNGINQVSTDLNETLSDIQLIKTGEKYKLHNPTYMEVINFMVRDKTNRNPYDIDVFNCADYSMQVNNNAEEEGIRCACVIIKLSDPGINHACIGFNTTDKGMVYYEPQTDEKVNLIVGLDYWADCVIPISNYYYIRNPDNIIEGFEIIW